MKRPILNKQSGITYIELLIAMGVFTVIATLSISYFMGTSKMVEKDTGRVLTNQSGQGALDIIVADLRQAGENLELDLGISGVEFNNANKTLTVRRSIPKPTDDPDSNDPAVTMTLERMPICDVSGSKIKILGPKTGQTTPTAACSFNDANGDGIHDNISPWRKYFKAQNNIYQAAILYTPANASNGTTAKIKRVAALSIVPENKTYNSATGRYEERSVTVDLDQNISSDFGPDKNSMIILVDERKYFVVDNQLKIALGGQTDAQAQPIAFNVTDLQLNANLLATATQPAEVITSMALDGPWKRVGSFDLKLSAGATGQGNSKIRDYIAKVFPRNAQNSR